MPSAAVCSTFFTFQNITNHQSNQFSPGAGRRWNFVGQRRGCYTGERRKQHELQLVWYRTLLRSGGGVCPFLAGLFGISHSRSARWRATNERNRQDVSALQDSVEVLDFANAASQDHR